MWLFLVFICVPIIEIALFIKVGGALGLLPTLGIVILTAIAGTYLMRVQGMSTLARLQSSLSQGSNPLDPMAHGAFILVAGLLLLTPGFFTDTVGLSLLIPKVRQAAIQWIGMRLKGHATIVTAQGQHHYEEQTIDVEYEVNDNDNDLPKGESGWTKQP